MNILKILFFCLISTIIIEASVAYILKIKSKMDYINIILANILTNPIVASIILYVNIEYSKFIVILSTIILELFAVIVEGILYHKFLDYKNINSFILSFILNFCSYFIGLIINIIVF